MFVCEQQPVLSLIRIVLRCTTRPTTIFYPMRVWAKVYKPRGLRLWLMILVNVVMALVAVAAFVGSLATIVSKARYAVGGDEIKEKQAAAGSASHRT